MYHRIATPLSDPWQLAVSRENFSQQLEVLQKLGTVVPVKDLVVSLKENKISRNTISITFDDGYRDNYFLAKPLLEKHNCAASFFITTHSINREQQFWWDELETILLHHKELPASFSMLLNGENISKSLANHGVLTPDEQLVHKTWVWPGQPPSPRCELYLLIWERLRPLPYEKIETVLDQIRHWAGVDKVGNADSFPMNLSQINLIANHPLFDIGIHTLTHPALASHSYPIQLKEISDCKYFLENEFGQTNNIIAYPYGDYNETTLQVVQELKLAAAFTTRQKHIDNREDIHQLGRFQVSNWNGEVFEEKLHQWFRTY
ncbi:MAG: polysaccharide deacetylase family protein [Chitinophagaceae bacterium]